MKIIYNIFDQIILVKIINNNNNNIFNKNIITTCILMITIMTDGTLLTLVKYKYYNKLKKNKNM